MPTISDWDLAATHALRKYVWQLLQDELGWTAADYGGLVPVTSPQQEPEFTDLNKPFIVYTYSKGGAGTMYAMESETVAFTIYSNDDTDINRVINLLSAKLSQRDISADAVNTFIAGLDDRYKAFDFKSVFVTGSQGPQPVSTEGGRKDGYVTVTMRYTHYGPDGLSIRF